MSSVLVQLAAKYALAEVDSNSTALINDAKALEVKVIDEVANALIARLPADLAPIAPTLKQLLPSAEASIVNALGGPDAALLTLVKSELTQLATSG
jgi:hypothetical protein